MSRYLRAWWPAILLGVATIGAYGTAYYSIGVLIPVIASDTGWSTGTLAGGYSLGVLGHGAVAVLAGRTFDRRGSRAVLLPSIVVGGGFLYLAALAQAPWQFVVAWGIGGSVVGGGLFYNVTMPVATRMFSDRRAHALSVLTLLGALASPIFYPVAGWLIEGWGWRVALQALVVLMVVCVAPAAIFVRAPGASRSPGDLRASGSLWTVLRQPAVYRTLIVMGIFGFATSAVLLHQVAVMQAAGLSIAAASGFAGARGFFQIPGRLLLTPLTARFGTRGAIGICYAFASTSALTLLLALDLSATEALVGYFAVVGGMSLGLLSPLNGLFQAEVYGDARLGVLSGVGVVTGSVAGASGAWLAGLAVDVTGSYQAPLVAVVVLQAAAIAVLLWQRQAMQMEARSAEGVTAAAEGS